MGIYILYGHPYESVAWYCLVDDAARLRPGEPTLNSSAIEGAAALPVEGVRLEYQEIDLHGSITCNI